MSCGYAQKFGSKFTDVMVDTHVTTVEALATQSEACLLAEIKDESIARFGLQACMEPVLRALEPVRDRAALISFQAAAVAYAKARGFAVGWCIESHDEQAHAMANRLRPELLLTDEIALHSGADLWSGDWRWACWEVVDINRAKALFELGVDYVETMACDRLAAAAQLRPWCS